MTIEQQIINAALAAVKELYGQEVPEKMVQLQKTKKEFEGNLTLAACPIAIYIRATGRVVMAIYSKPFKWKKP